MMDFLFVILPEHPALGDWGTEQARMQKWIAQTG